MTHSGGKPHTNVGDQGQRYQVTYLNPDTRSRKTFGWSDTLPGVNRMCNSINLHPSMHLPLIIDREENE